jgi:hypothetical protein
VGVALAVPSDETGVEVFVAEDSEGEFSEMEVSDDNEVSLSLFEIGSNGESDEKWSLEMGESGGETLEVRTFESWG